MRRGPRGSLLIVVLLITAVLFVGGLALSVQQQKRYAAAVTETQSLQALSLAEAGLEDVRVKLDKDPDFPPKGTPDQTAFTYSEALLGEDGQKLGSYTVTVDSRYAAPPFEFFLVRSQGEVDGTRESQIVKIITGEVDVATRTLKMRAQERM